MGKAENLDRLFNPSSIAIVGASKKDITKGGGYFLHGLITSGYQGKIYAINPKETEVLGQKSYPNVLEVPGDIDLVIIAVQSRFVPQVMADCSRKGVKFVIVHSAGFSELGPEGKDLENEMLKFANEGGVRVIGPNCMGVYCTRARINTISPEKIPGSDEPGHVAFIGQSGWVTENVATLGVERGIRFSKVLSIGNQSDLTIEEMLLYLAEDPDTHVIAFYAEGIKRGKDFLEIARQVSKKKPIIAWKGGRSAGGARAASSHTGSLAGSSAVMDAVMKQGGFAITRDLEELMDFMAGFSCPVLPQGNKIGLMFEAGGGAVAACDAAETLGLDIPVLSVQSQNDLVEILKGIIPPFATPKNPVDIVWAPSDETGIRLFIDCSRVMLREVDAVVMLNYLSWDDAFARAVVGLRNETGKPVLVIPAHLALRRPGVNLLTKNGVPAFPTPERALKTLAAMVKYAEYRRAC